MTPSELALSLDLPKRAVLRGNLAEVEGREGVRGGQRDEPHDRCRDRRAKEPARPRT